jgi:hypothetical protein
MPPAPRPAPDGRVTAGLALVASVGLLAALFAVRYLPTHDGPQHIFLAHLDSHFSDPGATYSDFYRPTTALTSKGFALLYGPLAELLPWRSAVQVTLAIILLTWSWGTLAFVDAVSPARRLVGLVGFAMAFQWALYMGLFSFLLSTGLGLFTLAVAFGSAEWTWKRRAAIAALLLVQSVCHVFAAEVVGLTLAVLVACRHPVRQWPRELGILAAMGVPTALIGSHAAGWLGSSAAALPYSREAVWPPIAERIHLLASAFSGGPWWRAFPPVVLAVVGIVSAVRRTLARKTGAEERTLLIVALMLGAAALAMPLHSRQWEFMSVRFTPMAVVFGLALLPVEALSRRLVHVVHGVVVVMAVSSIAWAGWHNQRLERACGPALAGLDANVRRDGPRLPIVLDPSCNALSEKKVFDMPGAEPLLNLGALYAVQQGGVVPYAFVGIPQLHGFVLTPGGFKRFPDQPDRKRFWGGLAQTDPVDDAPLRQALLTSLARTGTGYQDVIFYGTTRDRDQIARRGYVTDFERDGMWLGHYRGCPLRLEVRTSAPPSAPLIVQYGWAPLTDAAASQVVAPSTATADGVLVVDWPSAPCGALWVRAGIDKDGSGRWSPSDGHCAGAADDGRLTLQRTPDVAAERCVLQVP